MTTTFKLKEEALKSMIDTFGQERIDGAITALKSGKYEKYRWNLCDFDNPTTTGCCLHVIAVEGGDYEAHEALDEKFSKGMPSDVLCKVEPKDALSLYMEKLGDVIEVWGTGCHFLADFANVNDNHLTHPQIAELLRGKVVEVELGDE